MKKIITTLLLIPIFGISLTLANQNLGELGSNQILHINGYTSGQGMIGYGFFYQNEIQQGTLFPISGNWKLDQDIIITDHAFFAQIPKETQIIFIITGNLQIDNLELSLKKIGFFKGIIQSIKDFRKNEPIMPYSINLKYGPYILGTSLTKILYFIFIIVSIILLILPYRNKLNKILYLGIILFLFFGIKNLLDNTNTLYKGLNHFSFNSRDQKALWDQGDFISFTKDIRDKLELDTKKDTCTINIKSYEDYPFLRYRKSVYLKPCDVFTGSQETDYSIYYHIIPPPEELEKQILIQNNDNYLIKNK